MSRSVAWLRLPSRADHGEHHGQAAGQKDGGVGATKPEMQMLARSLGRLGINRPVDDEAQEKAAEQHQLRGDEQPKAEPHRLMLLRLGRELRGDGTAPGHVRRSSTG